MLCDHLTYLMVLDRQDHLGPYRCFFLLKVKVDCSLGRDILEECDCPDNVLLSLMDSGFYCNIYSCSSMFFMCQCYEFSFCFLMIFMTRTISQGEHFLFQPLIVITHSQQLVIFSIVFSNKKHDCSLLQYPATLDIINDCYLD